MTEKEKKNAEAMRIIRQVEREQNRKGNIERHLKDIKNGHKKDCIGYDDPYCGVDCDCFDGIECYEIDRWEV